MKCDVILSGVGGQGVLSIAAIIARAAAASGINVRQSEVHGMAQRGGAVLAHLRLSDGTIHSDLVPQGSAQVIISTEPLESLRYASWLAPSGVVVSAADPFVNIPDYPDLDRVLAAIRSFPRYAVVEAEALAKKAGSARTVNIVMVGAASPFLPVPEESLLAAIDAAFGTRSPELAAANREAFRLGQARPAGAPD